MVFNRERAPAPAAADGEGLAGGLEEVETERNGRLPFALSRNELKLLGIAGVGFFLDAYDLFIVNQVATLLQYRLYGGKSLPSGLQGFIKAGANIGAVIGQFLFGYLADSFGRRAVYGKELMVIIFGTIMSIADPTNVLSPSGVLIWLGVFRVVLGIGVGGDYPMSASVMSDRARVWKRGALLGYIFANQGWGSLVGSIVTMVTLAAYHNPINNHGEISKTDGVWRIIVGVSLIPAFGTLYQRLTLAESKRFVKSRNLEQTSEYSVDKEIEKENGAKMDVVAAGEDTSRGDTPTEELGKSTKQIMTEKRNHFNEFIVYFGEWRHFKNLFACAMCWFLLDIAFYGINLNTNVVLQEIGFGGKTGTAWHKLFQIATGNLIITVLGFVPGYYVSILTVEYIGRKVIQIQGFLFAALFLAILAGGFNTLSHAAFVVNFALLQFFFNFGANTTTFLYPAEIFPTRFRASAHGMCAASGKAGAIISSLAFNSLSNKIGTPAVLWIFFGCSIAGAVISLLLPEVKGRDPDEVDAQEIAERRRATV